jgi:hypothetical protein
LTALLLRLFAFEAIVPRGHKSHGREAQGKSQENTDENDGDHGLISFPFKEIMSYLCQVLQIGAGIPDPSGA